MTMRTTHVLTIVMSVILVAATPSRGAVPVPGEAASSESQKLFEGDWETTIGTSTLLFRFQFENGGWSGWFVSRKTGQSYPLKAIEVKKKTLSFTYPSKPEFRYVVTAQKGNQTLSGISSTPDGDATPRSLVRIQQR